MLRTAVNIDESRSLVVNVLGISVRQFNVRWQELCDSDSVAGGLVKVEGV